MDIPALSTLVPFWLDYVRREELNAAKIATGSSSLQLLPANALIGNRLVLSTSQIDELHRGPLREYLASLRDPLNSKPYPDDIYLAIGLCLEQDKNSSTVVPLCLLPLGRSLIGLIARTENAIDLTKASASFQVVVAALTRNIGLEDMELDSVETSGSLQDFCESLGCDRPATIAEAAAAMAALIDEHGGQLQEGCAIMKLSLADYSRRLQEDLQELSAVDGSDCNSVLAQLLSESCQQTATPQEWIGQFSAFSLSDGQATVLAQLAAGERLVVCDGPPGTGKTELALNAIANQISRLAHRLAKGESLAGTRLPALVVSDTNKAIENIVDSIAARFPNVPFIWLKTGSAQRNREAALRVGGTISILESQAYNPEAHMRVRESLLNLTAKLSAAQWRFETEQQSLFTGDVKLVEVERELAVCQESLDQYNIGQQSRRQLPALERISECAETIATLITNDNVWGRTKGLLGGGQLPLLKKRLQELQDVFVACGLHIPVATEASLLAVTELQAIKTELDADEKRALVLSSRSAQLRKTKRDLEKQALFTRSRLTGCGSGHHQQTDESAALMRSIFETSVVVLWHEALYRKDELIDALALYQAALESQNSTALPRIGDARREFTALVSLVFPLIACSMNSLRAGWPLPIVESVELAIADEAVMTHCHKGIPLAGRSHAMLVLGDPRQLPAIVSLSRTQLLDFANSWGVGEGTATDRFNPAARTLYSLAASCKKATTLVEHRRATTVIANTFCTIGHYPELTVFEPILTPERAALRHILGASNPLVWLDVVGRTDGNSNAAELATVSALMGKLAAAGLDLTNIPCCITPFRAQEKKLTNALCFQNKKLYPRQVGTVHKFQGQEYPLVIFSVAAGSSDGGAAWFLRQRRDLINVAASRAQESLVVVGSLAVALETGGAIGDLARHIIDHGAVLRQGGSKKEEQGVRFEGDECLALAPYLAARSQSRLIMAINGAFDIPVLEEINRLCVASGVLLAVCLAKNTDYADSKLQLHCADISTLAETTFICDDGHVISGNFPSSLRMPNAHSFSTQDLARMKIEELRQRMPAVAHPLDPEPAGLVAVYDPELAKSLSRLLIHGDQ